MIHKGLVAGGVALGGATVLAVAAGDGSIALAVVPVLLFVALYATWRLPLRWPLLVLTFLAVTLENPADAPAQGLWKSPLYTVGALLLAHMNITLRQSWMLFSGLDLALLYLGIVVAARSITRTRMDGHAYAGAKPMRAFVLVALGGAAWMWLYGMVRGGADFGNSLWQLQRIVYLPVLTLLFLFALRGPRDFVALGKVLVVAACVKASLALYIVSAVPPPPGKAVHDYATTHHDSMLFADAACLVVVLLLQRQNTKRAIMAVAVLALLIAGLIANNRRVAWVEIAAGLGVVLALARRTRLKVRVLRGLVFSAPALILYGALGWSSNSSAFRPVQVMRSVVDSNADMSTAWRDSENFNICYTVRQFPFLGSGYGHGYIEIIKLPDISADYSLYRFAPHNAILGLWAYGGVIGFTALWMMFVVGIFLAARAHEHAKDVAGRVAALGAIIPIVVYLIGCWGDMALGSWVGVFTTAPALAVGAKLAVASGAWSDARAPRAIRVDATVREVVA